METDKTILWYQGFFIGKISWFEPVSDNGDIQWVEHLIDDEIICGLWDVWVVGRSLIY